MGVLGYALILTYLRPETFLVNCLLTHCFYYVAPVLWRIAAFRVFICDVE